MDDKTILEAGLQDALHRIKAADERISEGRTPAFKEQDYQERYRYVLIALSCAEQLDLPAGIRLDPSEPEWPVAYIELPTGQVSWHLPQHPVAWDGHTTEEKYRRVDAYAGTATRGCAASETPSCATSTAPDYRSFGLTEPTRRNGMATMTQRRRHREQGA